MSTRSHLQQSAQSLEPAGAVRTLPDSTGAVRTQKPISATKELRRRLRESNTQAIKLLYASDMTLQEIGDRLSISRERVRQILKGYITANEGGKHLKVVQRRKAKARIIEEKRIRTRQHGRYCYVHYGCRCVICTKANTDFCRAAYHRRKRNEQ